MSLKELIDELSLLSGIVPEYRDVWGRSHTVSSETKEAILKAMGFSLKDEREILSDIDRLKHGHIYNCLASTYVISKDEFPPVVTFYIHHRIPCSYVLFVITLEKGGIITETFHLSRIQEQQRRFTERGIFIGYPLRLPADLPEGYHRLELTLFDERDRVWHQARSTLIITPASAYLPEKKKLKGLYLNLYSINSKHNQAIGDFSDLKEITIWAARRLGVDFIGINPLHITKNSQPDGISPYSPITRIFKNPVYIDLTGVESVENSALKETFDPLKKSRLIDYRQIYKMKNTLLKNSFEHFYEKHYLKGTPAGAEFKEFVQQASDLLQYFAVYMSLYERYTKGWQHWPLPFQNPHSREIAHYLQENTKEILYYQYQQWLIKKQFDSVVETARKESMHCTIYTDLALGSCSDGFDTWYFQGLFAKGIATGAPPDKFNPSGQNWGFPPIVPQCLRQQGYGFFVELLRSNMVQDGVLRIDHILGLNRLYWIPDGFPANQGAYVRYPFKELIKILCLESSRQKTTVVGEDLGTVPSGLRKALSDRRIFSFRVLYFEKDDKGRFIDPGKYPELSAVTITTHDLPTFAGYWLGRDIELKKALQIYPDPAYHHRDSVERETDRNKIIELLQSKGLISRKDASPSLQMLVKMIYLMLIKSTARFVIINLDDLLLIKDQQNMPGTTHQYPNWQQRLPMQIEDIKNKLLEVWPDEGHQFKTKPGNKKTASSEKQS